MNDKISEQKTESFAVFQASSILLGMLTQIEDTRQFYAVLASSLLLLISGMIQRTYIKTKTYSIGKKNDSNEVLKT